MSAIAVENPLSNSHVNGLALNEDVDMNVHTSENSVPQEAAVRFATGLILPPPEIKSRSFIFNLFK